MHIPEISPADESCHEATPLVAGHGSEPETASTKKRGWNRIIAGVISVGAVVGSAMNVGRNGAAQV